MMRFIGAGPLALFPKPAANSGLLLKLGICRPERTVLAGSGEAALSNRFWLKLPRFRQRRWRDRNVHIASLSTTDQLC